MFKLEPEKDNSVLIELAEKICVAARTAPKANGRDFIVTAIVYGDELKLIQDEMRRFGEQKNLQYFVRDASNIDGRVVVLIGTRLKGEAHGFDDSKGEDLNNHLSSAVDLGIAIGSAVSVAADLRVDNRVMYSIGRAAVNVKLLGEDVKIAYGIPLSVSGKNPFFDRR
ncbi:MAG: ferredoxin domain-containing protein [Caldisericaceae bacterium]